MDTSPVVVLETKLQPPRRPMATIDRPRLHSVLDGALDHVLTVVSAPAGYGKSTLVASWLEGISGACATAWCALDEHDDDVLRFSRYVGEAIARADPALADSAAWVRAIPLEEMEEVLVPILNQIGSLDRNLVLVLDDFHVIRHERILSALAFAIEYAPPTLHIVVVSRWDPALPLARLRVQGHLLEIRADDLRFDAEEVRALYGAYGGGSPGAEDLTALVDQTEGWAAGVQLVALAARDATYDTALERGRRHAVEYLASEVFAQLDEETRRLLLAVSILDRVSGPLADALTEHRDGVGRLRELYARNLFLTSLDARDEWFRFHPVFLDYLRRSMGELSPEEVALLHRRASRWFEAHDLVGEAVTHALAAGDEPAAVAITVRALIPSTCAANSQQWSNGCGGSATR